MVASAELRAPEVSSRQGTGRQGQCRGTTTAAPRAPVEEHQGKHILGEAFLSGKERLQEGHSEKRVAPPVSKALGSPLTCLQVPQEDRSSLPRGNLPILSWESSCQQRDGSGCTACPRRAPREHEQGCERQLCCCTVVVYNRHRGSVTLVSSVSRVGSWGGVVKARASARRWKRGRQRRCFRK